MNEAIQLEGLYARATREAVELCLAEPIARALIVRALHAEGLTRVPEDIERFRVFVEGVLRMELERVLDATEIALVLERLGHVVWMATSDTRALSFAKEWARASRRDDAAPRESGSHPRLPPSTPPASASTSPGTARRPTIPAPSSAPPAAPRSPLPPRATATTTPMRALRPPAVTERAMQRVASLPASVSAVWVVSLDPSLAARVSAHLAGRAGVVSVVTPADLARTAAGGGERVIVLVDTMLPSIDVPTFAGLAPILPAGARVVLWGVEERQRLRIAAQYAVARSWTVSGDASAPDALERALTLR